jgi:hypothetical protein
MRINEILTEGDGLSRRGFLKGLGAVGIAAAGYNIVGDVKEGKRRFIRVKPEHSKRDVLSIMGDDLSLGPKIEKGSTGPWGTSETWTYNGVGSIKFYDDKVVYINYVDTALNNYNESLDELSDVTEGSDERKQAALWAQITKHEQAAKKSKDLKQQHHLKMADQLRSQLKTNDEPINEFAPPEDNDEGDDIEVPHYDRLRRAVWREGLSKVKPQKFATFKLENKGKIHSCYGISADGVEVKIFTTPSKEVAEDIYTAYMIRNQG